MFTQILHNTSQKLRHERKFALNYGVYEIFKRRCNAVMKRDEYSIGEGYRITSLYFEDIYRTAYKDKVGGYYKRRKFRIRAYNMNPDRIVLEGKVKEGEHVYKTTALLTQEEYEKLLRCDYGFCADRKELHGFYVWAKSTNLKPAVIVDYYREAFTETAGNVRITFDRDISAGFGSADMFKADYSPAYEYVVMEIKFDEFLPPYIQELFSGFALTEEPISKYLICADTASQRRIQQVLGVI
ncbi:MAG: polyphosphate polymerase domain-containing protein [Oscillospiraceae bacterium]|nr:polyphosphate polymerase domain-containing protein [Oscillospiraceae bacterium]